MDIRAIVLLSFVFVSLPFCLVRPFYGIVLWTILAFLNPQQYTWSADSFPWALAAAIPTLFGFLLFVRDWKSLESFKAFLIVILAGWFTVTSLVSTHTPLLMHHAEDTWYHWQLVSKVLLMTVVTIGIINSFAQLRIFVLVIAASFGFFVLKAFPFIISTGGAFRLYGPPNSMIGDNNDLGLAFNMTLPLFLFLAQTETKRWVKLFFGFLFVIMIPAVFFTYSRGALVGLVAILLLMFLQLRQRLLLVPVIALGAVIAVAFAPAAWKARMDPTREDAVDNSARERLNAWAFSRALASDFPIAGGGFATFTPELFSRYAPNAMDVKGPHSVYFQLLAEHGYVGLFIYLVLVFSCFTGAHRLVKQARFHNDRVILHYANMFRFSLVGFLSSGAFLGRAYFDYFFSIVACLIILERVAQEKWAESLQVDPETVAQLAEETIETENRIRVRQ